MCRDQPRNRTAGCKVTASDYEKLAAAARQGDLTLAGGAYIAHFAMCAITAPASEIVFELGSCELRVPCL
ncbi:MAG TPA: hypothetical protein VGX94_11210 [Terriglobia bacterium]|nr:hypothetical protein [Terriglobia bacterium]